MQILVLWLASEAQRPPAHYTHLQYVAWTCHLIQRQRLVNQARARGEEKHFHLVLVTFHPMHMLVFMLNNALYVYS